ncbi:BolA family protein [Shewanella gelidii]|uniref:DNA-binding transcriptional regulator BolA n=1 Tax=Shewanella gelidii TaxID=1642821 RepID=A0A917JK85_9GAMM|nr:BolA/IbaG family iron-sulfur metabolism protein [Shewanella gelidii]MCL1097100.1 BolA/IbaG family iron-sulfur metabolism protein [Shewanella gelidii]GGI72585.1 global transcriptional regulator BolA [Shewanella gelidii]
MLIAQSIKDKLGAALSPTHLEIINESHKHRVPKDAETHFKVVVVSEAFVGKRLIGRHRAINEALSDEFAAGLHSLSMYTYTPEEWAELAEVPDSPKCTS